MFSSGEIRYELFAFFISSTDCQFVGTQKRKYWQDVFDQPEHSWQLCSTQEGFPCWRVVDSQRQRCHSIHEYMNVKNINETTAKWLNYSQPGNYPCSHLSLASQQLQLCWVPCLRTSSCQFVKEDDTVTHLFLQSRFSQLVLGVKLVTLQPKSPILWPVATWCLLMNLFSTTKRRKTLLDLLKLDFFQHTNHQWYYI